LFIPTGLFIIIAQLITGEYIEIIFPILLISSILLFYKYYIFGMSFNDEYFTLYYLITRKQNLVYYNTITSLKYYDLPFLGCTIFIITSRNTKKKLIFWISFSLNGILPSNIKTKEQLKKYQLIK
jgi:hypothetical protein